MNTKNTNTKLEQALMMMVESFIEINATVETMNKTIDTLQQQVTTLNEQVKAQELDNLPDWVDAATAMKIINVKDVDTLRAYAKRGLITQQRGADRKNYYPKLEVLSLPGKLVELGALKNA